MTTRITACGSRCALKRMNVWLDADQISRLQNFYIETTGLAPSRSVVLRRALDLLEAEFARKQDEGNPAHRIARAERRALEHTKR